MTIFVFKFFLFFDYQLQDKIFSKEDVSNNVIIIAIDEKSIQNYGQWPWHRSRHADLIEKLEKNNVKVIGYDFTFSERSSDDEYFLETIKKYDNLVFPFEGNLKLEKNQKAVFSDFLFPLKEIRENSLFGFTTLVPDFDAKVRRAPLFVYSENKEEKFYPFFLLVLERANYLKKEDLTNYNFKLDSKNLLLIKFFGPRETFKTFSYLDVMNESFDASIFNNKIVLVGATAKNLHDEYFTPTSKKSAISGVEIQANLIESFLQNNFLYRVENTYFYFLLFLFLLFLTRKIALKEKFIFSILNLFLLIFFYILFVIIVHVFGYLFSIFYPILFIIIFYFISYLKKYFQ
jgi:adenylate cyclase